MIVIVATLTLLHLIGLVRRPPACPNGCQAPVLRLPRGVLTCPTCGAKWRHGQLLDTGNK